MEDWQDNPQKMAAAAWFRELRDSILRHLKPSNQRQARASLPISLRGSFSAKAGNEMAAAAAR